MLQEVDQDLLLQDFGLSISAGAVSGLCILDKQSEIILDGRAVVVDYTAIVRTDQFGWLQYGNAVDIDGKCYTVAHEPMRIADGLYCLLVLEEAGQEVATIILDGDWL